MATSLTDRLTVAIRTAEQSMLSAQYQADYRNWHEVHRVLQDVRDELGKPQPAYFSPDPTYHPGIGAAEPVKLDGRTKAARAAKAASQ